MIDPKAADHLWEQIMRELVTLIFDVIVFLSLVNAGAGLQMWLNWPAGIETIFFVPSFAYAFYRHPYDRAGQRLSRRSFATLIGSIVIGMVIAFDVLQLPGGSYLAIFIVVGVMEVTRRVFDQAPASKA